MSAGAICLPLGETASKARMPMWSFGGTWFRSWTKLTLTFQPMFSQFNPAVPNSRGLAFEAVGLRDTHGQDLGADEREDDIADGNFAHALVVVIPRVVGLALRRPAVPSRNLVAVCLVLVDPPF